MKPDAVPRFYYLGEGFLRGAVRLKEVGGELGRNDIALTGGDWKPAFPLRFQQYEGESWLDCVGTQWANIKLVSARVVTALEEARLGGWDTYEVEVLDCNGDMKRGYCGLVARGRCGPIDDSRSVKVDKIVRGKPGRARPVWKGMFFDESTWDGTDLFRPVGTGFFFATQAFVEALDRVGAQNVVVTPLDEFVRIVL